MIYSFFQFSRQPLWSNDPKNLCFAGILHRYLDKLSPGQTFLFCYESTDAQKHGFSRDGNYQAQMSPGRPIGVNTLTDMMKEGARLIGMNDPDDFSGHALRQYFVSKLYNSDEVSAVEAMSAARHRSVSASATYIERNSKSEAGRFRALGAPKVEECSPADDTSHNSYNSQHFRPLPTLKVEHSISPHNDTPHNPYSCAANSHSQHIYHHHDSLSYYDSPPNPYNDEYCPSYRIPHPHFFESPRNPYKKRQSQHGSIH